MQVQVSGKHVDVGEALGSRISQELKEGVGKYFERGGENAEVVVSKDGYGFKVDCWVRLASGQALVTTGLGGDAHAAFTDSLEKLEKRVRRYKRRLTDRHEQADHARGEEEAAYTIFMVEEDEEKEVTADAPLVIAETRVDIPTASVADAVMMMDLRNTGALFFKNAGTGRHNMVYRRADGSIGWVEPR